ncbi:unnamed protein product [Rodentolepis nana]|uniref:Protein kinase domain-containing protein n=1 Tax=Rodentolepis nana TaxID=102285 RepID=A0A0R3TX85_RODNA|nr:unnamed protein product [Rodentolepis nana]
MCVMASCDLEFVKVIEKGRFLRIYETKRVDSGGVGGKHAVKLFTRFDPKTVEHILCEEYMLRRIATATNQPPFVITYFESMELRGYSAFLLSSVKCGGMTEEQAKFYACELICGLEHLHSLDIVHCDIKPENIFPYHTGHIMIADFDFAVDQSVRGDPNYRNYAGGTPGYVAPEILKRMTCTKKSDVWSMAAVIGDLVSARMLRVTRVQLGNTKSGTWYKPFLANLTNPFQLFFTRCFREDYRLRPAICEVKQLNFFEDVDWQMVENLKLTPPFHFLHEENSPQQLPQVGNINDDSIVGGPRAPSEVDNDIVASRPKSHESISFHSDEDSILSRSPSLEFNEHCEWVPIRKQFHETP